RSTRRTFPLDDATLSSNPFSRADSSSSLAAGSVMKMDSYLTIAVSSVPGAGPGESVRTRFPVDPWSAGIPAGATIEVIHGRLDSLLQHPFDAFGGPIDSGIHGVPFLGRKRGEHMLGELHALGIRSPDPDPEAGKPLAAQPLGDRAQSEVSAVASPRWHPDRPQIQGDIVADHQQIRKGHPVTSDQAGHRLSASIHERPRAGHQHPLSAHPPLGGTGPAFVSGPAQ